MGGAVPRESLVLWVGIPACATNLGEATWARLPGPLPRCVWSQSRVHFLLRMCGLGTSDYLPGDIAGMFNTLT